MTIANALKEFFLKLNGAKPGGTNIADVIRNGANSVQLNDGSAQSSIVLLSSTEDSVKKFSVTVDDSGVLTATEIVAE